MMQLRAVQGTGGRGRVTRGDTERRGRERGPQRSRGVMNLKHMSIKSNELEQQ